MEKRAIGSLRVSEVGLGCNNFGGRIDEDATRAVIHAALDAGIDFFDTADNYGNTLSETFIGRILGARRSEVVIATKFGGRRGDKETGARPEYVKEACEASLQRLATDRIDLYQLHVPDSKVPIADTLGALEELVQAGKVREIGCSNFGVEQLQEAHEAAKPDAARFASVQNHYSLFHREPESGVLDACARLGQGFLPYFPLACGLLSGKYKSGEPVPAGTRIQEGSPWLTPENLAKVERYTAFAESRGRTVLELAFAWLLARPVVSSVIAGATKPEQVRANADAAAWRMTPEEFAEASAI